MKLSVVVEQDGKSKTICTWEHEYCVLTGKIKDVTEEVLTEINRRIKEHFGVEEQVTESNEWHTCPYAKEIHNDYDTLCDCDEERTYQCAQDI
jgi:hemerythrin